MTLFAKISIISLVAPLLTSVTLVVVSIHDDNDYTVHISDSCSPTVVAAAGVSLAATSPFNVDHVNVEHVNVEHVNVEHVNVEHVNVDHVNVDSCSPPTSLPPSADLSPFCSLSGNMLPIPEHIDVEHCSRVDVVVLTMQGAMRVDFKVS
ncbi:serine-repeat antigen [Plasmodium brasilianum]|uniref:Serine-repeat antigen n=1 Tax=Plasmodium brasilianum TaxID=5824 RepID=A0ACB9YFZ7_PLABR|nr:serine-repeat antigen [Plasmodium brasilianum]